MRRTRSLLLVAAAAFVTVGVASLVTPVLRPALAEDTKARKAAEKMLRSKDPAERERAVAALEELGWSRNVGKALEKALGDDDWAVKIRAIQAIGRIGTADAKEDLEELAVEGIIHWVREASIEALAGPDAKQSADHLLERARHERDETTEARALRAAGRLADKDQLGAFGVFLDGKELESIAAAADAVGHIAARHGLADQAFGMLKPVLRRRDEQREFRAYRAAVAALGLLDSDEARDAIVAEVLAQETLDGYLPERVGRALAAADGTKAAAALERGIVAAKGADDKRLLARLIARCGHAEAAPLAVKLTKDGNVRVRAEALRALRLLNVKDTADAVRPLLTDDEWMVRLEAVSALAVLLEPAEFRKLGADLLEDDSGVVRLEFVVALADEFDPAGLDALVPYAADEDWRVASAAIATIGTLGIAEDLPKIEPYFEHKDWRIRGAAFEAVGRLRAVEAIPILIEALSDRDPVPEGVALANLRILSGETHLDADPKPWRKWWKEHNASFEVIKRSRRTDAQKRLEELRRKRNEGYAGTSYAVEILQKSRILVQLDSWDHVEIVLEHLEIPHVAIRAQQLKDVGLNPNQVLLVNCAGNMDRDAMERVRWFTNVGGYVMTTDWALTKTVMPCFPGYMEQYSRSSTGNDVVVVEEATPGHDLTAGIFGDVPALQWWLEVQAFPITVSYPERCTVIVDSAEMKERYGSSPMATEFRWGLGRVQHSLSHFYLQEEGMQQASKPLDRKIFAADHLGLSLAQIRDLEKKGAFTGGLDAETMKQIAPDYSMFRIIVNLIAEKSDWVENL